MSVLMVGSQIEIWEKFPDCGTRSCKGTMAVSVKPVARYCK